MFMARYRRGRSLEHHLVVAHHLFEAQRTLGERRNAFDHQRAGVLAAAAVHEPAAGLWPGAGGRRRTGSDGRCPDTTRSRRCRSRPNGALRASAVVLVLDRTGVGRKTLAQKSFESLRQVGAPQNREVGFGTRGCRASAGNGTRSWSPSCGPSLKRPPMVSVNHPLGSPAKMSL